MLMRLNIFFARKSLKPRFQRQESLAEAEKERHEAELMSKLIEEERLKMIEKVSHDLLGYMPKGIIRDYNDLEPLGEKYKEAYRPKTPDACGDC